MAMIAAGSVGLWLTAKWTKNKTIEGVQNQARQQLELYSIYLTSKISGFSAYPIVLAENSLIISFCDNPVNTGEVNAYLSQFNASVSASASYILNKEGVAIASSDWDSQDSYMHKNYAVRPYYKRAIHGLPAGYVGTEGTSGETGYYASYPIRKDGEIIGVAVVKNKLDSLKLGTQEVMGTLVVADENDVIFASNDDMFTFYTMRRLPEGVLSEIKESKQYEGNDLVPLPVKSSTMYKGAVIITLSPPLAQQHEVKYVMETLHTQENSWNVYLLSEIEELNKKIFINLAIAFSIIVGMIIIVVLLLRVRFRKMKEKFIKNQRELELKVEERTHEIREINETLLESRTELEAAYSRMNEDMIELQRISSELRESAERFRLIAESVSDVIWTLDSSMDNFTYVSPSIAALRGFTVEEAVRETLADALTPESYAYVRETLTQKLACFRESGDIGCFSERFEVEQKCKGGKIIPVEVVISVITGEDGNVKEFVGISRDITERKREEEKLKYSSTHDAMTGLYNRAYFDAELQRIARGRVFPVSFVVADLDGLKRVNDSSGHDAGDQLIRGASDVLKMAFRGSDVVARTGGDEFLLILSMTDEELAAKSVERIRTYQEQYNRNSGNLPVSISLGAATAHSAEEIEPAIKEADKRMYEDKVSRKQQRVG
ncbi:MAG: diguanylate cyclase [Nitrospirae bacterium]|nr:diguanylate cyclase [Nitrospirota bacterium]